MTLYSTDTVCSVTGVLPTTLRCWRRAGLIAAPASKRGYTGSQLTRILTVQILTHAGDTLQEVHTLLTQPDAYRHSGWACREEELLTLLNQDDTQFDDRLWQMGLEYSSDAFVHHCLRPLNLWLRSDFHVGATCLLTRFHAAMVDHAGRMMNSAYHRKTVPLFLEAVSVTDATEIWLEAIRLTGQGFRVELSPDVSALPATALKEYEHHVMWCGAGISHTKHAHFQQRLEAGDMVMLSGPDTRLVS